MARNSSNQETWDDFEHDEVDTFHEQRDRELESKASSGRRRNARDEEEDFSDEEIMGLKGAGYSDEEEDDDDEDEFEGEGAEGDEDEEEGGWGKKSNYYGADDLENDEDKEEEEAEALRLQKKHLSEMKASDFFEEDDFKEWEKSAKELESASAADQHVLESLPTQDAAELSVAERTKLLDTVYPEAKPLAEELVTLLPQLEELKESSTSEEEQPETQLAALKYKSLSAYLGTINAYFSLLITNILAGGNKINLKEHAVMEGILKGREVWRTVSSLETGNGEAEAFEDDEEDDLLNTDNLVKNAKSAGKRKRDAVDEDDDEEEDEEEFQALASDSEDEEQQISNQDEDHDSDLDIDIPIISKQTKKRKNTNGASDFGEATSISKADLADKQSSKRNLRYYTAKIDQQSAKVREKLTGDSDLPYKERRFERQQRLNEEARKRGQQDADNFGSDNEDDEKTAREVRDSYDDDYYNMVAAGTKQKKIDRKEAHAAAIQAAKEGRLDELQEEIGENGKRAINYQILKNKGLTPKRKKEDRNARVKKRKKYDAAKKKLSSVRRVYKQPTASYGGEETGIKKNMVRSVKFT
ncbi:hypothetical protein D0Z00_000100 [Geotrichum galactomycetum]|uniref:Uncharacterized protein n=1 Tax=Geotrichum galactomycetum TaxID=27317 RepID=A0ACB6VAX0_9ASCO|nr:hypothetical protein D0Z00_000100 [Geotrichum candidum]